MNKPLRNFELHMRGNLVVAVVDPTEQSPLCAPRINAQPHDTLARVPEITGHGHRVKVQARNAIEALSVNPRGLRQTLAPRPSDPQSLWAKAKQKLRKRPRLQTHFPEKLLPPTSTYRTLA